MERRALTLTIPWTLTPVETASMTKTREERRKIAHANGAKGRGPVTPNGKAISSRNSLKLGIYSKKTIVLADEDENLVTALRDDWYDAIRPQTPAAQHFT